MKILLISHFFPPGRVGGAENITLNYAVHLNRLGHEVQVLCAGDWDSGDRHWNGYEDEVYRNIAVRRINFNWQKAADPNRYLYDNPEVEAYLDEWIDTWKPDIVHIVSLITLSASVIRAAKKHGLPVVFTLVDFWLICPKLILVQHDHTLCNGQTTGWECIHCLMSENKRYAKIHPYLPKGFVNFISQRSQINRIRGLRGMALDMDERKRFLAECVLLVDYIAAPSGFLGKTIEQTGIISRKIPVIPYGHDLSWLETMPKKIPSSAIRMGYIGQIIPLKGIHLLIEAYQKAGIDEKAQLSIYGNLDSNPDYGKQLTEMAGPSRNIRFMGAYPHEDLGKVLSNMDLIIVPSLWHENNPLVIQEAFASKTPVIGSNVGGISEFIQTGINGFLFEYNNVEILKEILQFVVSNPDTIARLREGILPVKKIETEVNEYVQIYEKLLKPMDSDRNNPGSSYTS